MSRQDATTLEAMAARAVEAALCIAALRVVAGVPGPADLLGFLGKALEARRTPGVSLEFHALIGWGERLAHRLTLATVEHQPQIRTALEIAASAAPAAHHAWQDRADCA